MWCHLLKEDECSERSQIALAAKKYIMPGSILSNEFQNSIYTLYFENKNGDLKNDND